MKKIICFSENRTGRAGRGEVKWMLEDQLMWSKEVAQEMVRTEWSRETYRR